MRKIYSHKNKELQVHSRGVESKASLRGYMNEILRFVSLFHDIAKTNIHFHNYLFGKIHGYADHSYLSTYIALYLIFNNKKLKARYQPIISDNKLFLNIVSNIITHHHGNLRNIDSIFFEKEVKKLKIFINGTHQVDFQEYINVNFKEFIDDDILFNGEFDDKIFEEIAFKKSFYDLWKNDPLKNYYDTIFNFAQLIEADKRDASDNSDYVLSKLDKNNFVIDNNVDRYLSKLKTDSELNKKRLEIRLEAENNLLHSLKTSKNRMFEVTAPTGSGKTFMMLKLASIIQKEKGNYGIIMSLPFTSIIDQASHICDNDLLLDVLNYTSISNTSHQMERLMKKGENYTLEDLKKLISHNFSEETFDHSFIITTFVQFFQTLIANRNSVLIKLPNFSKRIFLIDEFQSMSSNLYTFFYGILQYFCETYDCYCILSTATMPNFRLNDRATPNGIYAKDVFKKHRLPIKLVHPEPHYASDVFNRYIIENIGDKDHAEIVNLIQKSADAESVLCVMNTVDDSTAIFNSIKHDKKYLLNRNFTTKDKLRIIDAVSDDLKHNRKVLLVSTQVIEAGVDLDFPIVYRDTCPLPSLIQTAGRCNRNGKKDKGYVYVFNYYILCKGERQYRARKVYLDRWDFGFIKDNITLITENQLFRIQKMYYKIISEYKTIGRVNQDLNLLDALYEGRIEDLGNYKMIEDVEQEYLYYVGEYELWKKFSDKYKNRPSLYVKDYLLFNKYNIELKKIHKEVVKCCVNVTFKKNQQETPFSEEVMDIRNLANKSTYSAESGFIK